MVDTVLLKIPNSHVEFTQEKLAELINLRVHIHTSPLDTDENIIDSILKMADDTSVSRQRTLELTSYGKHVLDFRNFSMYKLMIDFDNEFVKLDTDPNCPDIEGMLSDLNVNLNLFQPMMKLFDHRLNWNSFETMSLNNNLIFKNEAKKKIIQLTIGKSPHNVSHYDISMIIKNTIFIVSCDDNTFHFFKFE